MKTFSRPLFDEDSIALVSAGSLALVFELRCIDSKFSINRKKGHARVQPNLKSEVQILIENVISGPVKEGYFVAIQLPRWPPFSLELDLV